MPLKTIRLELARTPEHPEGSAGHGYVLVAPLDEDGHLDVEAWRQRRSACTVRRFWVGEDDRDGRLIHTRHRTWAFSYAPGEEDDTPLYRLERHRFVVGEYVTIAEHEGEAQTFRVVEVG